MARIAFIVATDFEDSEFRVPYEQVKQAGHEPVIIGMEMAQKLKGKKGKEVITTEATAKDVKAEDFAALVIPGGYSPDHLRADSSMVELVRAFAKANKPIAAICHGPWMMVEADIVDGRTVTSFGSIKTDLINAGGHWTDREVVEDGNLITSRKPADLEAFCTALLRQIQEGPERSDSSRLLESMDALPSIH